MSAFRKGDRVTVKAEVTSDAMDFEGTEKIKVSIEPYHDIFVLVSDLTMDRPDIRVGDTVRIKSEARLIADDRLQGEVRAVADDHAWVVLGDGSYTTWWLPKVERVDPTPAPELEEVAEPPAAPEVA